MTALPQELAKDADAYIDQHHDRYQDVGQRLFETFDYDQRSGRVSTQVRNLQQIVCSAARFADIEDFVKNQMGKDTDSAKLWRRVGDRLLEDLARLRAKAEGVDAPPEIKLAVRLRLARAWVRAVVSAYLYCIAKHQMEHSHA